MGSLTVIRNAIEFNIYGPPGGLCIKNVNTFNYFKVMIFEGLGIKLRLVSDKVISSLVSALYS